MSEAEINNVDDVRAEAEAILREYNLSDEEVEDAARRITNLFVDALEASRNNEELI